MYSLHFPTHVKRRDKQQIQKNLNLIVGFTFIPCKGTHWNTYKWHKNDMWTSVINKLYTSTDTKKNAYLHTVELYTLCGREVPTPPKQNKHKKWTCMYNNIPAPSSLKIPQNRKTKPQHTQRNNPSQSAGQQINIHTHPHTSTSTHTDIHHPPTFAHPHMRVYGVNRGQPIVLLLSILAPPPIGFVHVCESRTALLIEDLLFPFVRED